MSEPDNYYRLSRFWSLLAGDFANELGLNNDMFLKAVFERQAYFEKNNKGKGICEWEADHEYDESGRSWETSCGRTFVFSEGGPKETKMSYCCFCGKNIKEKKGNG